MCGKLWKRGLLCARTARVRALNQESIVND